MSNIMHVVVLCVLGAAVISARTDTFTAYRAVQLEKKDGTTVGATQGAMRGQAVLFEKGMSQVHRVVVAKVADLPPSDVAPLFDSSTAGILLLLPLAGVEPKGYLASIQAIEQHIVSQAVPATYFAYDDGNATAVYGHLQRPSADNTLTVVSPPKETEKKVTPPEMTVFHTLLKGKDGAAVDGPTLAIVADYDTMGPVPHLAGRTDGGGSGAIALVELLRIMHKMHQSVKGSYNLLFVLSAGSRFSYSGTKQWLADADPSLLDSIEVALCLETLAQPQLFLHVSKKTKDERVKKFYELLASTAASYNVPFKTVQKKVDVSHYEMRWAHEAFSYRKVVAATLSSLPNGDTPQFHRSSLGNTTVSIDALETNVRIIAEAIARTTFDFSKNVPLVGGSWDTSKHHMGALAEFVRAYPRSAVSMKESEVAAVSRHLSQIVGQKRVQSSKYRLRTDLTVFEPFEVEISVHHTKSFMAELVIFGGVVGYLVLLSCGVFGVGHTLGKIKSTLTRFS